MDRDDIILSFQPLVKNVIKKYNDHKVDEDLLSIGTIKSIEAVDRCLSEGVTDPNDMQKRVIVWVRNAILNEIYVRNNLSNIDSFDENTIADDDCDYYTFCVDVKNSLEGLDLEIFKLLNQGYNMKDICKKLCINKTKYYNEVQKIKEIILEK